MSRFIRSLNRKKSASGLTTREFESFERSLKIWCGFVAATYWSTVFDCSVVDVWARLLEPQDGAINEFLSRYPVSKRERYRGKVKRTAIYLLAELACEEA